MRNSVNLWRSKRKLRKTYLTPERAQQFAFAREEAAKKLARKGK